MQVAFMRFTVSCRMAISTVTVLMATSLAVLAVTLLGTRPAQAQDWKPDYSLRPRPDGPGVDSLAKPEPVNAHMFDGPASPEAFQPWLRGLRTWREQRKKEIGYHDDLFQQNELSWARLTMTQDQLLVWDRSLYDPVAGEYTIDRALAGIESRLGPLDSVLIWSGYPNLGLDDRNQFDLMRETELTSTHCMRCLTTPGTLPSRRNLNSLSSRSSTRKTLRSRRAPSVGTTGCCGTISPRLSSRKSVE